MDMNGEQRRVMKGIRFQDWVLALIASEKQKHIGYSAWFFVRDSAQEAVVVQAGGVFQQGVVLLILQISRQVLPASVLGKIFM